MAAGTSSYDRSWSSRFLYAACSAARRAPSAFIWRKLSSRRRQISRFGMAAGLEQRRDRGFTGQPALVRRTAVEAREAGCGFFDLDRVVRDHLHGFASIHSSNINPLPRENLQRNFIFCALHARGRSRCRVPPSTNIVSTLIKSISNSHVTLFDHLKTVFRHSMRIGATCISDQR